MSKILYHCRLDILQESDKTRFMTFISRYPKWYVYEEDAKETGKLHYHSIIECEDQKYMNAVQKRFNEMFRATHTKGHKASSQVKTNLHIYVCKDGKRVAYSGYTEDDLNALEQQAYQPENNKKIKNNESVMAKLIKEFNNQFNYQIDNQLIITKLDVMDFVLECYKRVDLINSPFCVKTISGQVMRLLHIYSDKIHQSDKVSEQLRNSVINALPIDIFS